jgi:hypothetical protein
MDREFIHCETCGGGRYVYCNECHRDVTTPEAVLTTSGVYFVCPHCRANWWPRNAEGVIRDAA